MRYILVFLTAFSFCTSMSQDAVKYTNGASVTINGIKTDIRFFSPTIVRIVKTPEGTIVKKESLSVTKNPEAILPKIDRQGNVITFKTTELMVEVNLVSGKVLFKNASGDILLSEKDYGIQFTPVKDVNKQTFDVRQAFFLDRDEVIYGLGQQQNGRLNQRSQKVYLRQDNMKVCIPFFQSVKGYGIFWDNYSPTVFTDNPQETSFDSEVGDCADYYFMYGGGADGVVAQMRELTGQAPMMPLWTYGFNQSRERYKTQFELVDVVKKYRALKIPLDGNRAGLAILGQGQ